MVLLSSRFFVPFWILTLVGAQTLYGVSEISPSPTVVESLSRTISAIGVGADGATTYVEEGTESFLAFVYPSTTQILLSTPSPFTGTFVQDASGERFSASSGQKFQAQTCGFGADGQGTCVEKVPIGPVTETQTYSGPVVPVYTLPSAATFPTPLIPLGQMHDLTFIFSEPLWIHAGFTSTVLLEYPPTKSDFQIFFEVTYGLGTCVEQLTFGPAQRTSTRSGAAVPFYLHSTLSRTYSNFCRFASPNITTLPATPRLLSIRVFGAGH
ncbi:hypothetical protein FB451DRAFT_1432370 [Mycena latifolia]|nr:hypothetical protein FB451DRAFT_1432370 [Mycena latifolia]